MRAVTQMLPSAASLRRMTRFGRISQSGDLCTQRTRAFFFNETVNAKKCKPSVCLAPDCVRDLSSLAFFLLLLVPVPEIACHRLPSKRRREIRRRRRRRRAQDDPNKTQHPPTHAQPSINLSSSCTFGRIRVFAILVRRLRVKPHVASLSCGPLSNYSADSGSLHRCRTRKSKSATTDSI